MHDDATHTALGSADVLLAARLPLSCSHGRESLQVTHADCEVAFDVPVHARRPAALDAAAACKILRGLAFISPVCARLACGWPDQEGGCGWSALFVRRSVSTTWLSEADMLDMPQSWAWPTPVLTQRRKLIAFDLHRTGAPPAEPTGVNWMNDTRQLHRALKYRAWNAGNGVWLEGARRLVAEDEVIMRSASEATRLRGVSRGGACCRPSALLIPAANWLLPYSQDGAETPLPRVIADLTSNLIKAAVELNVPTMVLGLGVQVGFHETRRGADAGYSASSASNSAFKRDRSAVRPLDPRKLLLPPPQRRLLATLANLSRDAAPNIGLRGDVSRQVCRAAGGSSCASLGCPSLMLNADAALGAALQAKWRRVFRGAARLRLAFYMPARWSAEFAQLVVNAGREHGDFVVILQMAMDVASVHRLRRMGLLVADAQVRLFTDVGEWAAQLRTCDLVLSGRIHGALLATVAAAVPAVVVSTDVRIDELAARMLLPSVRTHALEANLTLQRLWPHIRDAGAPPRQQRGRAFDANRADIARAHVRSFEALGIPVSERVVAIAGRTRQMTA